MAQLLLLIQQFLRFCFILEQLKLFIHLLRVLVQGILGLLEFFLNAAQLDFLGMNFRTQLRVSCFKLFKKPSLFKHLIL
jgi:hypothetical protein